MVSATSNRWITAGVLALYFFGSIISFFGIFGAAPWLKGPSWTWWFVPLFIDAGIIVYKFAEIRLRLDPRKAHLAGKAKMGVLISTVVSSLANGFHVFQQRDPDLVVFFGGITIAALSPWFIYLAGSVLTDVVVKPKPRKGMPAVVQDAPVNKSLTEAQLAQVMGHVRLNVSRETSVAAPLVVEELELVKMLGEKLGVAVEDDRVNENDALYPPAPTTAEEWIAGQAIEPVDERTLAAVEQERGTFEVTKTVPLTDAPWA